MRLVSWNVNGLRARVRNGGFLEFCKEYSPDFVCLQEIKMYPWQKAFNLGEVFEYWNPSTTPGVSGTAIFSKRKAISSTLDMGNIQSGDDGRVIALEFVDFYLVTAYVPTGSGPNRREMMRRKMTWLEGFTGYIQSLNRIKPVILCGDLNIAHNEIDLSYPDPKGVGFTDEERAVITRILESGFCDSFRYLHPKAAKKYTWVSNGFKEGGLRLDYFLVSNALKTKISNADILREKALLDHCPILLELDI